MWTNTRKASRFIEAATIQTKEVNMNAVFVILVWQNGYVEDLSLVTNHTGKTKVFTSHKKAQEFAEANLNFNWKIIEIDF